MRHENCPWLTGTDDHDHHHDGQGRSHDSLICRCRVATATHWATSFQRKGATAAKNAKWTREGGFRFVEEPDIDLRSERLPSPSRDVLRHRYGHDLHRATAVVNALRRRQVSAYHIAGGTESWRSEVLSDRRPFGPNDDSVPVRSQVAAYLSAETDALPPRYVYPGATPPQTRAAAAPPTYPSLQYSPSQ